MEIIKEDIRDGVGAAQSEPPTNTPAPNKLEGCLSVFVKVALGLLFLGSTAAFISCVIGAVVLIIISSGVGMSIEGVDLLGGPIFIAVFACALCAIAAAFVAYLSFCVAFRRQIKGWIVAFLIVLFVGSAVGGTIYGVNLGIDIYSIEDEIEQLERQLDAIDENDNEQVIRALLSSRGERKFNMEIEEWEDLVILDALDIDVVVKERVREVVIGLDEEVRIKVKQEIDHDRTGTREITIYLPDEDVNIIQSLPIGQ